MKFPSPKGEGAEKAQEVKRTEKVFAPLLKKRGWGEVK
jgi:hypothetical protein